MNIVIVILCALAAAAVYFFLNYRDSKIDFIKKDFQDQHKVILNNISNKKTIMEKEVFEEIQLKINRLEEDFKAKKSVYEEKRARLDKEYSEHYNSLLKTYNKNKQELDNLEIEDSVKRMQENKELIAKQRDEYNAEITKLKETYEKEKNELDNNFLIYKGELQNKKEQLDNTIKDYEARQDAIIEQFKKAEAARQEKDFYRIKLSDSDIEDVKKLRKVADSLYNPTILYKLIWENYYKTKFSELVGRVAPNNKKCGIYKITNLNNGKVYIGQTRQTFNDRWRSHVRRGLKAEPGTSNKLYAAMWEEGIENFSFEILLECKSEELNEKEKYFISFFKAQEWGYNSTGGG